MTGTIIRGKLTRGDLAQWDGRTTSYSRLDATGGTTTGAVIGNEVDVFQVFGSGTARTRGAISAAIAYIGSSTATLTFAPGTWSIDDNLTIPSNFTCRVPGGCVFDVSSGKTLTFNGPVLAESGTHTSGLGSVVGFDASSVRNAFYKRTDAESSASVTPTNYAYKPGSLGEIRRYHSGTVGNSTDDDTATDSAIAVIKQDGSVAVIPPEFSSSMAKPSLSLSNSQSGGLVDLRLDRSNTGNESFGSIDWYFEGKDSGGNYATEFRVLGKQNPSFTIVSLSDGTATGYTRTNFSSSFLHKHGSVDQWQLLSDPLFGGYYSWAINYFAGSTGKTALYASIDANSKPRFTLAQANLTAATGNISGATNASPIVITTSAPHTLAGVNQPVTIASVGGNTAANGDWEVTVLSSTTFSLNGSTGNGAYTAGGTFSGQKNHSRATLNVPKIQGGTEAVFAEGTFSSGVAQGSAPIVTESDTGSGTLHARPYVVNINGTQQSSGTAGSGGSKVVIGNATIGGGGTVTVTLTGDAVFTSSSSYKCSGGNLTGARAFQFTRTSGSSITITGTASDSIDFMFVGF